MSDWDVIKEFWPSGVYKLSPWPESTVIQRMAEEIVRLRNELVYQQLHSCRPFKDPRVEWRPSQGYPYKSGEKP